MKDPVSEFLEIEKEADLSGVGGFLGQMGIAAGTVAAGAVMNEVYHGIRNAIGRAQGFKRMMEHNPALMKQDRAKVQQIYNTLYTVSPDLAKDPLVSNSWVNRMMYQDEYIDPKTMSDLASAQKSMAEARRHHGLDFAGIAQEGVKASIGATNKPYLWNQTGLGSKD